MKVNKHSDQNISEVNLRLMNRQYGKKTMEKFSNGLIYKTERVNFCTCIQKSLSVFIQLILIPALIIGCLKKPLKITSGCKSKTRQIKSAFIPAVVMLFIFWLVLSPLFPEIRRLYH